jgi:predicted nuclease of predicted toxin-antitoxin system
MRTLGARRSVEKIREGLHNLNSSPNTNMIIKTKDDDMGEACSRHGSDEQCIKNFSLKI